jgi:3-oxoadipate enol-lactonase
MSAVILENRLVHYEVLGRGRPLLLLHDWLGSWRYWVPTMVEMSSSYRAYALDFWGFGDSDKAPADCRAPADREALMQTELSEDAYYSIPAYTAQVRMFMDHMGIDRTPMVGHGLGAVVALCLAQAHPRLVDQVMTVSLPLGRESVARGLAAFDGAENPAKAILGRRLRAYKEVEIEAAKTDGEAVGRSLASAFEQDLITALRDQPLPTLLLSGKDDPIVGTPDAELLAGLGRHIGSFVFDGSQHYPMLDEPSKFSRLLRDFLTYRDDWDSIQLKDEWKRRMR